MSRLRDAIEQGEFVITCEFVPGRGSEGKGLDAAVDFAKEAVAESLPIHAVSLTDNPGGGPAILPDVIGEDVQKAGIDALVHFACRDLNRNAMEARASAMARRGIENVLVITGDYPTDGFQGRADAVFDLDSVQVVNYLHQLNEGLEIPGRKPGTTVQLPKTSFFIAAAVSPFKPTEDELLLQFFKMEKKIAAGANFIIPQLGYDLRKFWEIKRYIDCRRLGIPVLGNVYVLSYGAARAMNAGNVPGCVVSDELVGILKDEAQAEDKGKAARLERAAKMVAAFKGMGFAGVHIGGFGLKTADFRYIIERASEIEDNWQDYVKEVSYPQPGEFYAFPPPFESDLAADEDPAGHVEVGKMPVGYRMILAMHHMMFEEGSTGNKLMTRYFSTIGEKGVVGKLTHYLEHQSKQHIFGCQDCGDCGLPDLAYCCAMANCAKKQRNGPCGGSRNGMCEAFPDSKPCIWVKIFERLKSRGHTADIRENYVPPRRTQLEHTSGWANYFLGRDHNAAKVAATKTDAEKKPAEKAEEKVQ